MKPSLIAGKTIKTIDARVDNAWHVEFTDGTKVTLTAEVILGGACALKIEKPWE